MTRWPGRSAGWALPAKTTWTGRSSSHSIAGQAIDVAEQQAGPLVGREPAREADRQDVRVEGAPRARPGPPAPRRGGRTGCAAGRARRWASSRFWRRWASHRSRAGIALEALPEPAAVGWRRRGRRGRRRGPRAARRSAAPIQVGPWTPLVMPRIGWSMTPCQVALAVCGMELADGVRAAGQRGARTRSCRTASGRRRRRARARGRARPGTPPASSSGPATRRTRSASNRSLPAETGVWIVKTLSRRTVGPGVVERRSGRPRTRGHVRRAGTPSGPR